MNIVFDFAGVVFHWEPERLLERVLPGRPKLTPQDFFAGYEGDWLEFDCGRLDARQLAMRIAIRIGVTPEEALAVIRAVPHELTPDAAMVALIDELRARGAALYYLSNMPMPYAEVLEAKHAEVIELFRHGLISGRVGMAKPQDAIFARAEAAFGIKPAQTLYFDDVQVNVVAASGRGWHAVRWESAAQCRAELAQRGLVGA